MKKGFNFNKKVKLDLQTYLSHRVKNINGNEDVSCLKSESTL